MPECLRPDASLIRRLLIRLDPLFFSYSAEEQNTRRQRFNWTHSDQLYELFYQELFSLIYNKSDEDILTPSQRRLLNAHTTALLGVGENSFRFNEFQDEQFDLTTFESLYEYDRKEYQYQQQAMEKEFGSSKVKPYRLYLNHNWARFLVDGDFYYSTLSSLSRHLCSELETIMLDLIDSIFPNELVEGPNHGQNAKGGMIWDMTIQANGKEAELAELQSRACNYLFDVYERLSEEFHQDTECAVYFLKHQEDPYSSNWDVVVKNASSAKKISFMSFISDCLRLQQPMERVHLIQKREEEKLRGFITDAHHDIMTNFDPTVVPLRKKYKVIMTPGALDDLAEHHSDDEP